MKYLEVYKICVGQKICRYGRHPTVVEIKRGYWNYSVSKKYGIMLGFENPIGFGWFDPFELLPIFQPKRKVNNMYKGPVLWHYNQSTGNSLVVWCLGINERGQAFIHDCEGIFTIVNLNEIQITNLKIEDWEEIKEKLYSFREECPEIAKHAKNW